MAAGMLQAGDGGEPSAKHRAAHPDERMSVFWRVFGGTILSIAALIGITIYNNQASAITELRAEVSRLNEARAEMVKKEEFNTSKQAMWDRVQSLQELRVTVTALKEQVSAHNEKAADAKSITDKLSAIDQRLKAAEDDHKALGRAELAISGLEQKVAAREAQVKALEDDRKDLARQLLELRERLAKVEGVTEVKPMPKTIDPKAKGS
jgi:chromosome segregation ATPase